MNSFISSVVSISLVLLLVGIASVLLVNARSVSNYFKENMQVSVIMKHNVTEEEALTYKKQVDREPFIRNSGLVSREQGTREMSELLGEDFLSALRPRPFLYP